MDEFENYAENIHEHSNEHAEHAAHHGGEKDKWVIWVAMTTAVIAVLAAITGLLAGDHADEAMLSQIHASDQWAFYQAKGIKSDVIASGDKLLLAMGKKGICAGLGQNSLQQKRAGRYHERSQSRRERIKRPLRQAQNISQGCNLVPDRYRHRRYFHHHQTKRVVGSEYGFCCGGHFLSAAGNAVLTGLIPKPKPKSQCIL